MGQFAPARLGQFAPARVGQLRPAKLGQFIRRIHLGTYIIFKYTDHQLEVKRYYKISTFLAAVRQELARY